MSINFLIQTLITILIYEFTKFVYYKIKYKTIKKNGANFTILRNDKEAEKMILEN